MSEPRNRDEELTLSAAEAKKLIDMIEDVERDEATEQEAREILEINDKRQDEAA
jgi:hypothetical protein